MASPLYHSAPSASRLSSLRIYDGEVNTGANDTGAAILGALANAGGMTIIFK